MIFDYSFHFLGKLARVRTEVHGCRIANTFATVQGGTRPAKFGRCFTTGHVVGCRVFCVGHDFAIVHHLHLLPVSHILAVCDQY